MDTSNRGRNPFAAGERRDSSYNRRGTEGRSRGRQSLYTVLGVTPKATHGEIKAAYYRLSKTFHPDRNKDNEDAVRRFREIADAYGVLGSHGTRRRYDRGLLTVDISGVVHGEEESHGDETKDDSRSGGGASSQWKRPAVTYDSSRRSPAVGHRSGVYNFDEWTKNHYGAMLDRDIDNRKAAEAMRQRTIHHRAGWKYELAVVSCLFVFIAYSILVVNVSHDRPLHDRRARAGRAEDGPVKEVERQVSS